MEFKLTPSIKYSVEFLETRQFILKKMTKTTFRISNKTIWLSSLIVGVLIALPKFAGIRSDLYGAFITSALFFLFTLLVCYYTVFTLPAYSPRAAGNYFSIKRLAKCLVFGLVLMFLLICVQQYLIPHLDFGSTVLMLEIKGILIYLTFYMFINALYQSFRNQQIGIELERAKTDNLWAQYELLKQQVNPHFLFNSLNTLRYMVESNDKHAVDFILKLSDFYRSTLESRKMDLIKLTDELKILDSYMYLLKARFEDGIELSIDIDQSYYSTLIPPFTLQLLIENCIKHNTISLDRPLGIRLYSEKEFIIIENKLQPKKVPDTSTGLGLENINNRYIQLLDKKIEILVDETLFTIKLPVIHEYYHH